MGSDDRNGHKYVCSGEIIESVQHLYRRRPRVCHRLYIGDVGNVTTLVVGLRLRVRGQRS